MSAVLYSVADAVATLTLNRPETKNAIDTVTQRMMLDAFYDASRNPAVRVLALKKAEDTDEIVLRVVELNGKPAPDIVGQDLDGQTFRLSDYRGKVVVLDFWGDW